MQLSLLIMAHSILICPFKAQHKCHLLFRPSLSGIVLTAHYLSQIPGLSLLVPAKSHLINTVHLQVLHSHEIRNLPFMDLQKGKGQRSRMNL